MTLRFPLLEKPAGRRRRAAGLSPRWAPRRNCKVLIVDDESPARERLRSLLAEIADVEVVGEAASGARGAGPDP